MHKALQRNPDSVLNGSLLNFTLTMSEDELKSCMKYKKDSPSNTLSVKLKSQNALDDTINFDLSKRSSDESLKLEKAFAKKKSSRNSEGKHEE